MQAYLFMHVIEIEKITVQYITIVFFCSGLILISRAEFKSENKTWVKYLFWNTIAIFGGVVILTYAIDLVLDSLIDTSKPIFWSIASTCVSLCIYFLKR